MRRFFYNDDAQAMRGLPDSIRPAAIKRSQCQTTTRSSGPPIAGTTPMFPTNQPTKLLLNYV